MEHSRCCLAQRQANQPYRLYISQFLHSTSSVTKIYSSPSLLHPDYCCLSPRLYSRFPLKTTGQNIEPALTESSVSPVYNCKFRFVHTHLLSWIFLCAFPCDKVKLTLFSPYYRFMDGLASLPFSRAIRALTFPLDSP